MYFKTETERLWKCRVRFEARGEDKCDPVEYNSRRATVKEKQTEHMAPLWSWLTLPYDTTVFVKNITASITDHMQQSIVWDFKAWVMVLSIIALPGFDYQ